MGIFTVSVELLSELYTAIGAGPLGLAYLLSGRNPTMGNLLKKISVTAITVAGLFYVFRNKEEKITATRKKVVFITGCDTGLGFSLAQHSVETGFTVVATFLDLNSPGCRQLSQSNQNGSLKTLELNLCDKQSIELVVSWLNKYFKSNPDQKLHALINNAGVMVFGEFEWQTPNLIEKQIQVNFLGPIILTNALAPLLRQFKGRIINFSSHCAYQNLPGICVYGGTKSALLTWSEGLRIEMAQYDVKVITLIPGSFASQTGIMQTHLKNISEMHEAFSEEQHDFYADYFKHYNKYLLHVFTSSSSSSLSDTPKKVDKIKGDNFYKIFENAILLENPDSLYKNETLRYAIYHALFKVTPQFLHDYFVIKFMLLPRYNDSNQFSHMAVNDQYNNGDNDLEMEGSKLSCDCVPVNM